MTRPESLLAGLLWVALAATPATAAEWPGWRGAHRDGKSPDTGLLKQWPADGPRRLWEVNSIGRGFSSVAVSGGRIYITGIVDGALVLFALDMDGKPQWKTDCGPAFTRSHPGARSTPTLDDGNLYLVTGVGLVGCYSAQTGRRKWTRKMSDFGGRTPQWGYAESVLILGRLAIITPGGENCIVALDKRTGRPRWRSRGFSAGAHYGSCLSIPHPRTPLIVAGTAGGIVGVCARTGRTFWSNPWSARNTANCPTPAYATGHVFWANGYGKGGICLKLKSTGGRVLARQAWTTREMDCHHGGYIVHDGYIYGNHGGGWVCLDLQTGERKWREQGVGKGSVCWADGMLYLFGEGGGRAALATCSPDGLEIKGQLRVRGRGPSWAHPVVIGGRLYLRYDTNLYCFDVRAKGS